VVVPEFGGVSVGQDVAAVELVGQQPAEPVSGAVGVVVLAGSLGGGVVGQLVGGLLVGVVLVVVGVVVAGVVEGSPAPGAAGGVLPEDVGGDSTVGSVWVWV
jgi:hypothetical protein